MHVCFVEMDVCLHPLVNQRMDERMNESVNAGPPGELWPLARGSPGAVVRRHILSEKAPWRTCFSSVGLHGRGQSSLLHPIVAASTQNLLPGRSQDPRGRGGPRAGRAAHRPGPGLRAEVGWPLPAAHRPSLLPGGLATLALDAGTFQKADQGMAVGRGAAEVVQAGGEGLPPGWTM